MAAQGWLSDPKTALTIAGGTTTTGLGEYFQWIPSDIGRLAALAGFILTCVIIWAHIQTTTMAARKTEREKILLELTAEQKELATEKLRLEVEELRRKIAETNRRQS
jgi:hypothetical protein